MLSYLDEKTCAIIHELLLQTEGMTVSALAQRVNLSRRVIYYHLDKVNDVLKEANISPISNKQKGGMLLDEKQTNYLSALLQTEQISYVLNTEERQLLLMFYIAVTPGRITLNRLMTVSETSRNTTLNDLATMRDYLQESVHPIRLEVNKQYGYHFKSRGIAIIEFMYALLTQIFQSTNAFFISLIKEMLIENSPSHRLLSDDFKTDLYCAIQSIEQDLGKKFIEKDLKHMVEVFPYLLLALQNVPNNQVETDLKEVFQRLEYKSAMAVMTKLSQQYAVTFSIADVYVATLMLLSSRKYYDLHINSSDYKKLANDLTVFIEEFEVHAGVTFENKKELLERLLMHCKVLIYRKKYNVFTQNPLKASIKEKYKDLFTIVKLCAYVIENRLGIHLNEDDIAYLTIHFGGALQHEQKKMPVHRVVILTDEGVGIQRLLVKQCKKYISRLAIVAIVSRVEELPKEQAIDFVVTTIKQPKINLPYITVNQIFQAQDIINLLKLSSGASIANTQEIIATQLNSILSQYVTNSVQRYQACLEIQKLLNEQLGLGHSLKEEKLLLLEHLSTDRLIVQDRVDSIEEVLQLLSEPMLQQGTITPNYIQSILSDVYKKGMYMSIYPEVLLLHSHYIPNETQTDVSFLYTKEPLIIDRTERRRYRLFILLATDEEMLHTPLIVTIDDLMQKKLLDQLKCVSDAKEMLGVIQAQLTNKV